MLLDKMDRVNRKLEVKRLEALKEDFMKDYLVICEKYQARLSPVIGMVADSIFRVGLSLDKYISPKEMPIKEETITETENAKQ